MSNPTKKLGRRRLDIPPEEILSLKKKGLSYRGISMVLDSKGIKASKSYIHKLIKADLYERILRFIREL